MLARNFATTTASTIIGMALSFITSIVLARTLGSELRGVYALAILIPTTIYAFGTFGISTSHIVYAAKMPGKRGAIAFQSLAFPAVIGLLTLAFYAYLLIAQPSWFQRFQAVGAFNLLLASFLVFINLAMVCLRSGVLGANRINVINTGTILLPLSQIVFILIFVAALKLGVMGGIISQLGCFGVLLLYMLYATASEVPVKLWRPDFNFFKTTFALGIKVHLNHAAWFVVHSTGQYMIAYLLPNSDKALGNYAVAMQFSQALWLLPMSLQTAFLPHLSVVKERDRAVLAARTSRILFIALLLATVVSGIGAPLIPIIFGADFKDAIWPFLLCLPGIFFFGCTRPMDSYLTHLEKPLYGAANSWIGAVANVLLNLYFIPRMGIAGSALASTISITIMAVITIGCFAFETKIPCRQLILKRSDFIESFNITSSLVSKFSRRFVYKGLR